MGVLRASGALGGGGRLVLAALLGLAWSPADAADWDDVRRRVGRLGLRWAALGVNFYRSPEVDWAGW